MLGFLLRLLLYPSPAFVIDSEQEKAFEQLLTSMRQSPGTLIPYQLPYPKRHFLHYLSLQGEWLFHGSNNPEIEQFEPREQTLFYNTEKVQAVFATTDPIWPLFYAVFRRASLTGGFRNGCIVQGKRRYHYYSLNASTMANQPWTDGMLYILPKETFRQPESGGPLQFDEWTSEVPVTPCWKIAVSPEDFYFADKVAVHRDNESLVKSWLLYKARTWRSRKN